MQREMDTTTASPKQLLLSQLETQPSALQTEFPELYAKASAALETLEFPTTRQEAWRYTRTARISNEVWNVQPSSTAVDLSPWLIDGLNAHLLVFLNGFFREDLSSSDPINGLFITPLHGVNSFQRNEQEVTMDLFAALHEVHCTDGLLLRTESKIKVDRPIHFIHLQSGMQTLSQPHLLIECADQSSLEVVLSFGTLDGQKALCNAVVEGNVGANAHLSLTCIEREGADNALVYRSFYQVEKDGQLTLNTHTTDGNWVRNDLHIRLNGTGIHAQLNGTYLPRGAQHVDNHTLVDHRQPHCESNELYKGVMSDRGKAVFNGKVYVRPDAQKTNAYQTNANIMLSDDASVYTKPELEIYADDVKCSHGSTTGQMDEEAVFYLRSRGLSEDNARKLLTTAFITDVLDRISNEAVRNHITALLQEQNLLID